MYILFEGVDTSGKSTQIELLKEYDKDIITTKEPGGTEFGRKIREIILNGEYNLSFEAEMFLFLSDRAQHYNQIIKPNSNKPVVSDRGFISGIAYAKANDTNIDTDFLLELNRFALGGKYPQKIVLFKTNKELIEKRLSKKIDDNIESRGIEYLLKVQNIMTNLVEKLEIENLIIDSTKSIETIHKEIKDFIYG